jgi:adenylate cyclase, class 2
MLYEYECKIIKIPIPKMRRIIQTNGGTKIHNSILFRRYLFFLPGKRQNGFIRLRSEGKDRVTLTCKIFTSASKYPKEDEIVLSSTFEQAYSFLLNCGLKEKSYIETRREKWRHPLAKEIVIDHWPGIEPYMEVDCENENNLKKVIDIFGFDKDNICYDGVHELYTNKYGILKKHFINLPRLDFKDFKKQLKYKLHSKTFKNKRTRNSNDRNTRTKTSKRRTRKCNKYKYK